MRNTLWVGGAIFAAALGTLAVTSAPILAAAAVGVAALLVALLHIPRSKVGSFGLGVAVTITVAIPASEFSGSFRQGISASATLIMLLAYFRSDVRRPVHKAIWLAPVWLLILGLGDLSSDGVVKWVVYSALVCVSLLLATRADSKAVLRWVVLLALVEVAVAALQVVAKLKLPWEQLTKISGNEILGGDWVRGPGTMGHPLPMVFLLVIACVVLLRDREWLPVIPRAIAFGVLGLGVALAGSRSGALILIALVIFASARRLNISTWVFGLLTTAVGLVLVVMSGFFESQAFEKIMASGSVYHRQGALESFGRLFNDQGAKEVFLGNGYSGVPKAFELGLLQSDGFNTVDNQFIALIATAGLLGFAAFAVLLWKAFSSASDALRLIILAGAAMFFIFDVLLWTSSSLLLMMALGFALSHQNKARPQKLDTVSERADRPKAIPVLRRKALSTAP